MLSYVYEAVNKSAIQRHGDKWTQPKNFIGNGAYVLITGSKRIVIKRNPFYWDNPNSRIEQATFLAISSEVSDINRYRSGEIDISNSAIPPVLYKNAAREAE